MKKYKLIKTWPDGPTVGTIFQKRPAQSYFEARDYPWTFHKDEVESSPEFFAPYLFTTEDGVDIYKGDFLFATLADNSIIGPGQYDVKIKNNSNIKHFSTREAAQKWIDSQNKPIWKTEDGYDVFENDNVKWVCFGKTEKEWSYMYDLTLCSGNVKCVKDTPEIYRVFKDEDKMNKWIEEQNKPNFEKEQWLYIKQVLFDDDGYVALFRFISQENSKIIGRELYTVWDDGRVEIEYVNKDDESYVCDYEECSKATPSQIEEILTAVAKHKGFKEGVKFKSAFSGDVQQIQETWFKWDEGLYTKSENSAYVYYKGEWAEIVEDLPEYVELLVDTWGYKKGDIAKVIDIDEDGAMIYVPNRTTSSTHSPNIWVTASKYTLSTKEAYNARLKKEQEDYISQFKQVTVTVEGEVTSVSSQGNQVKINYQ